MMTLKDNSCRVRINIHRYIPYRQTNRHKPTGAMTLHVHINTYIEHR